MTPKPNVGAEPLLPKMIWKGVNSPEEETKYSAAEAKAARIAALPVSCALKQRLCATATKVSWGEVINGRRPMVQYCQHFLKLYNDSTKSKGFGGVRASTDLRQAFFLGHTSDLLWFSVLRSLAALFSWARLMRPSQGVTVRIAPRQCSLLTAILRQVLACHR